MSARACGGDEALLEFRGLVGGAALIAGVHVGRDVRLVFPSRRIVADGPDEQRFWKEWTGASLDGALIQSLMQNPPSGATTVAGWTLEVTARSGEQFPVRVQAVNGAGDRLQLKKTSERPAAGPLQFPALPAGEDWRVVREAPGPASPTPPADHE